MQRTLLVVDDDPAALLFTSRFFEGRGWRVHVADSASEAIATYEAERPSVVLLDVQMPYVDGLDLLQILRERDRDSAVIMLTGNTQVEVAVQAMRRGAENFLTKPVNLQHLEAAVENAREKVDLRRRSRAMAERQTGRPSLDDFSTSAAMRALLREVSIVAPADSVVLLHGEPGTGKGWIAREIHARSPRATGPFVDVRCAGRDPGELAAELFGHERGARSQTRQPRRGVFELAEGGTLFLQEVGEVPLDLQAALLRTLELRTVRPVGATRDTDVDVRLITSTRRDLLEAVRAGRFREDLYYHLAVFPIHLSALRERTREDLVSLAHDLIGEIQRRVALGGRASLSEPAMDRLLRYSWPGNIYEMRSVLERAVILAGAEEIWPEHLPPELRQVESDGSRATLDPTLPLHEVERQHLLAALRYFEGNRTATAQSLGISRRALYDKIRRFGLEDAIR